MWGPRSIAFSWGSHNSNFTMALWFLVLRTNYSSIHGVKLKQLYITGRHIVQCEAPKIAFSWFITPIAMVYGTYNYSYWGESKPTYNVWGPHIATLSGGDLHDLPSLEKWPGAPRSGAEQHSSWDPSGWFSWENLDPGKHGVAPKKYGAFRFKLNVLFKKKTILFKKNHWRYRLPMEIHHFPMVFLWFFYGFVGL